MNERYLTGDRPVMRRRTALAALAGMGTGTAVFQRALAAEAASVSHVSQEMVEQAEWVAGIELTLEERQTTASRLTRTIQQFAELRDIPLAPDIVPALHFNPAPWLEKTGPPSAPVKLPLDSGVKKPSNQDELAFYSVSQLGHLLRTRQVSSQELTELYLERLAKYDPLLHCVVTLTPELAREQAKQADEEIASGKYRGPLHGIPWGAKDLIAVEGYPTTWGALPFRDQSFPETAAVAKRLEQAGAVLVAKLSLGALAQGDRWFGKMTRNPWNPDQGSSGSSAGSASAVAAGLVPFAIGSETLGSIVSPCRRCGTTGLRPTFGRISRQGCMALSWSMDKLGPIARTVEDCALVFSAIHGADPNDPSTVDQPFDWPTTTDVRNLKVGYFENEEDDAYKQTLTILTRLGATLVPFTLPDELPVWAMTNILDVEAGAAFDQLTRQGITEGLNNWPATFQEAQFIPAVDYLRANRLRTLLMNQMRNAMQSVDLYVGGNDLALTNLTGHPTVVLPNGFRKQNDLTLPYSITFTGNLYREDVLLAVAHRYQQETNHHLKTPPLDQFSGNE